jgi:hypothetical protein
MKAWLVLDYEGCAFPVHAETRGKSVSTVQIFHPACDRQEFIDFRAYRLPNLDNIQFTFENTKELYTINEEFEFTKLDFVNWCECELCDV